MLQDRVNEVEFRLAKEKAIREKGNFAFETNFSSADPTRSLREFKSAGYKIHLVFMGLPSIAQCIQRVSLRVKAGGHKVLEESIIFNFEQGYANLYKYYKEFDSITLFDNSLPKKDVLRVPSKLLYWEHGDILQYKEAEAPGWIKKFVRINNKKRSIS